MLLNMIIKLKYIKNVHKDNINFTYRNYKYHQTLKSSYNDTYQFACGPDEIKITIIYWSVTDHI